MDLLSAAFSSDLTVSMREDFMPKLQDPHWCPCSWEGHGTPSRGQGRGAGWPMNVGISCPGIITETPMAYEDTADELSSLSDSCISLRIWIDSKALLPLLWPDEKEVLGLKKRSNIAITRNIEIRMAVATKPNDTALTEVSNCFQWTPLSRPCGTSSVEEKFRALRVPTGLGLSEL